MFVYLIGRLEFVNSTNSKNLISRTLQPSCAAFSGSSSARTPTFSSTQPTIPIEVAAGTSSFTYNTSNADSCFAAAETKQLDRAKHPFSWLTPGSLLPLHGAQVATPLPLHLHLGPPLLPWEPQFRPCLLESGSLAARNDNNILMVFGHLAIILIDFRMAMGSKTPLLWCHFNNNFFKNHFFL